MASQCFLKFLQVSDSHYRHCEAALFLGSLASMFLRGCGGDDTNTVDTATMTCTVTTTTVPRPLCDDGGWMYMARLPERPSGCC